MEISSAPRTVCSTLCTCSPIASSWSKSSPITLMPMSDLIPETISFIRISMGCVKTMFTPGISETTSCIFATSSVCVSARFHSSRGLSPMKISVSSSPIGSVATSAVPMRLQACSISSGNSSKRRASRRVLPRIDSSMDTPANLMVLATSEPSPRWGMNSPPRLGTRSAAKARSAKAMPKMVLGAATTIATKRP